MVNKNTDDYLLIGDLFLVIFFTIQEIKLKD